MNFYFIRALNLFCVNILYEDKKKTKTKIKCSIFFIFLMAYREL